MRENRVLINPLRMSSAFFLVLSPFLTWITIVSVVIYQGVIVFGTAAQSNLLMVSNSQLGTNISGTAASSAAFSIALLLIAGIAMLKSARLGVPIGVLGLAAYLVPFYQMFGSQTYGLQQTFISPGIGFFVAGTGLVLGSISPLTRSESVASLLHSIRTMRGLSSLGASIGTIGLALDVLNHSALGQLSDFIGLVPVEQVLHLGLVAGILSMLIVVVTKGPAARKYILVLSASTLLLLGTDAVYSFSTGNLHDFLGHNLTETVLHLAVYYGVALTLISNFIRKD